MFLILVDEDASSVQRGEAGEYKIWLSPCSNTYLGGMNCDSYATEEAIGSEVGDT